MNKQFQIVLFVIYFSMIISCYAQVKHDTVSVQMSIIDEYFNRYPPKSGGGIYTVNGDTVSVEKFDIAFKKYMSIHEYVNDSVIGHYCKFYVDSLLFEEARWSLEYYTGPYKRYYRNGKLAIEGVYSGEESKYFFGKKVGAWKYYTEEGKLSKIEVYDDKSRIQKVEEYDKNGKLKKQGK